MNAAIDSSVLLALGKLGYLKVTQSLFDKLSVAQAVYEEISGDELLPELKKLMEKGFVEVVKCSNSELFNLLSSNLGKGEAETIVLALERKSDVALFDDLKARKTARRLKVAVMGTLAVLKTLIELRLINEKPEELCQRLIQQSFWIDPELCLKILCHS